MTHFKAGMSGSKLSWNWPVRPLAFAVYTPKNEEGGIYLCFRQAGLDLSRAQNLSLISVFSLVLDIPVPTICAELFDVSSILLFFPDNGSGLSCRRKA